MPETSTGQPCTRCKTENASYQIRGAPHCQSEPLPAPKKNATRCTDSLDRSCYPGFVQTKFVKRLVFLQKELAAQREAGTSGPPGPRRFAVGLSFGPSSSTIVHLLQSYVATGQRNRSPAVEILAVHVDTDLTSGGVDAGAAERRMALCRERYPLLKFEVAHLSEVLDVKTLAWGTLPLPPAEADISPTERLRRMFDSLPSATSRADVLRLLTRHLILHKAMSQEPPYAALILGHTATRLAALTLSEVANGRGFAVPWQVNDGPYVVTTYDGASDETVVSKTEFTIHYPVRELFENEMHMFASLTDSLKDIVVFDKSGSSVVSHKDQSIEDVTARYFETLDSSFSSIVSNVVRTAGKLSRVAGSEAQCGLCGVTLDERGDSRWAGEIGDEHDGASQSRVTRLCYGCKRSVNG